MNQRQICGGCIISLKYIMNIALRENYQKVAKLIKAVRTNTLIIHQQF